MQDRKKINFENCFLELEKRGAVVIKNYLPKVLLEGISDKIQSKFEYWLERPPGVKAGNIGIKKSWPHDVILKELFNTDLMFELNKRFPEHRYFSFGGNIALPKCELQRFHKDTNLPNIVINIPLIDVTEENGPLEILETNYLRPMSGRRMLLDARKIEKRERIKTKCGDIAIRFSNCWHRGTVNATHQMRPMLSISIRQEKRGDNDLDLKELQYRKFTSDEINFTGNIYPQSKLGHIMEFFDCHLNILVKPLMLLYRVIR